jgi:ubiquinone/menaquinone biosynthesis C-methylase UbiE
VSDERFSGAHRRRLALFLLSAIFIFVTMYVLYSGINTLERLEVVESERDQWQRPADILHALDVRDGNVVVDLGSGAGYFALKLSPVVGSRGEVLAVDIRKLSLFFLWVRAVLRSPHNVHVIVGDEDDPHLPTEAVDRVLIANTYHEFRDPRVMLDFTFRSLRSGGRLVVVDRGPRVVDGELGESASHGHEVPVYVVEEELRRRGFEIVNREDRFIDRPDDDLWWLLVARKP